MYIKSAPSRINMYIDFALQMRQNIHMKFQIRDFGSKHILGIFQPSILHMTMFSHFCNKTFSLNID